MFHKISELDVKVQEHQLAELYSIFQDEALDPFAGLDTEYKQEKFIQENLIM